ncbi:hypothetical protein HGRIS_005447 [Hohenbuehelia grisea]|uniref:Uncharacterized protein n=1 Tax=Hohenbuehelia grisea TaxID=104357 RepID=A0ABR3JZ48_9AGAR
MHKSSFVQRDYDANPGAFCEPRERIETTSYTPGRERRRDHDSPLSMPDRSSKRDSTLLGQKSMRLHQSSPSESTFCLPDIALETNARQQSSHLKVDFHEADDNSSLRSRLSGKKTQRGSQPMKLGVAYELEDDVSPRFNEPGIPERLRESQSPNVEPSSLNAQNSLPHENTKSSDSDSYTKNDYDRVPLEDDSVKGQNVATKHPRECTCDECCPFVEEIISHGVRAMQEDANFRSSMPFPMHPPLPGSPFAAMPSLRLPRASASRPGIDSLFGIPRGRTYRSTHSMGNHPGVRTSFSGPASLSGFSLPPRDDSYRLAMLDRPSPRDTQSAGFSTLLNQVSTATPEELDKILGVDPVQARRYRMAKAAEGRAAQTAEPGAEERSPAMEDDSKPSHGTSESSFKSSNERSLPSERSVNSLIDSIGGDAENRAGISENEDKQVKKKRAPWRNWIKGAAGFPRKKD